MPGLPGLKSRLDGRLRPAQAERLRAARAVSGLTVREVAAKVGVCTQSIEAWERGTVPMSHNRAALAELYGVAEGVLFAEHEATIAAAKSLLQPVVVALTAKGSHRAMGADYEPTKVLVELTNWCQEQICPPRAPRVPGRGVPAGALRAHR